MKQKECAYESRTWVTLESKDMSYSFRGEIVISALAISFIEPSQTHGPEMHIPHAIANGFNTNMLTGEQIADVDPPGIPVDLELDEA